MSGPSGSAENEVSTTVSPLCGAAGAYVKAATGARFPTTIASVAVELPVPPLTHSVTEYVPAAAKERCAVGPMASPHARSPFRSQDCDVTGPVDVDVNVTVSFVSGDGGEYVKEAEGATACAAGAVGASSGRRPQISTWQPLLA